MDANSMLLIYDKVSCIANLAFFLILAVPLFFLLIRTTKLTRTASFFTALSVIFPLWFPLQIVLYFVQISRYSYLSVLAIFIVVLLILAFILIIFTKLSKKVAALIVLATSSVLAIALFLWNTGPIFYKVSDRIGIRAQALAAKPYIQQSLDEQCGFNHFTADVDQFYFEYTPYDPDIFYYGQSFNWQSKAGTAQCSYTKRVEYPSDVTWIWDCSCP